jgi:preprotein translocase subunit SecD
VRLGWRLWLLGFVLALSVISIIRAEATIKLFLFLLIFGIFAVLSFVKSKPGRIIIVIVFLAAALLLIVQSVETGVLVKSVDSESEIFESGLRQGMIITSVNGESVVDRESYANIIDNLFEDGVEKRIDLQTKNLEITLFTNETPEITVSEIPKTKINTGLDLQGGSRALVQADTKLTDEELNDLISVSRNRFNVYGLSDVQIKGVSDLEQNKFMLVEVAGSSPEDLEELVSQQGKFEAKIGNDTVFSGGDKDISDVCRNDATCAGVSSCFPAQGGYGCNFAFTIYLKEDAAKRHADITGAISLDETGQYLSESLILFVDDQEVDSLLISASLRGQVTTQISIQGSGSGPTQDDALADARDSMNQLQTILITGSLPYKLEIVKLDTISPNLGNQFVYLILIAGGIALVLVGLLVFIRYRRLFFTAGCELVIILGVAALINWNLDLPSIAGILATVGTGVDQQIVILDEARTGRTTSLKERMKRAMFIIGSAYVTSVVSLIPLYWAGAGLFKGFALTTIIGITAGVLITRPAFAEIIKRLEE